MKKLTTPLFATVLALATRLAAAEPESAFGLAPAPAPSIAPASPPPASSAPSSPGIPLIPDSTQSLEKPAQNPAQSQPDRTAAAEDKIKHRVEVRLARNKAERDPDLQALKAKGYAATTDFEQRKLFIAYFALLVERMGKVDPALKKEELDALRSQYASAFLQVRVSPTVDPATFHTKHN